MLKKIILFTILCLLLTSLAWAGAGWKKPVHPAKPSIYNVAKEVEGLKQDLQALKQKVEELQNLQAKKEKETPEQARAEERLGWLEKQANIFGNWFSTLGGILAAIVIVVASMFIFLLYKIGQLKRS